MSSWLTSNHSPVPLSRPTVSLIDSYAVCAFVAMALLSSTPRPRDAQSGCGPAGHGSLVVADWRRVATQPGRDAGSALALAAYARVSGIRRGARPPDP